MTALRDDDFQVVVDMCAVDPTEFARHARRAVICETVAPDDLPDLDEAGEYVSPASGALAIVPGSAPLVGFEALIDAADALSARARSDSTRKSYASDWRDFTRFCAKWGRNPVHADEQVVRLYIAEQHDVGKSVATIGRRLASIAHYLRESGYPDNQKLPTQHKAVLEALKGLRNEVGTGSPNRKEAIVLDDLRTLVKPLGTSTIQLRDRALLLLGFSTAFRRSELCSLNVADVEFTDEGLKVFLRRSKTDQVGKGREVGVPRVQNARKTADCAVAAVRAWLDRAGIVEGPLFRSVRKGTGVIGTERLRPRMVARIVKQQITRAGGIDGLDATRFGAHSLRAGVITTLDEAGCSESEIARVSGHKSMSVLRGYMRTRGLFEHNALTKLFG